MKVLIENKNCRLVTEANFVVARHIRLLAEYIEGESLNKFGLMEITKSLREHTKIITDVLNDNIEISEDRSFEIEAMFLRNSLKELSANHFGYSCNGDDLESCLNKSGAIECVRHKL